MESGRLKLILINVTLKDNLYYERVLIHGGNDKVMKGDRDSACNSRSSLVTFCHLNSWSSSSRNEAFIC